MRGVRRLAGLALMAGLSAAAVQPASAAMLSGRDLANTCADNQDRCIGYIMGVIDQWGWLETQIDQMQKCRPDGVTTGDFAEIVTTYLAAYPEKMGGPAPPLVTIALVNAFTC